MPDPKKEIDMDALNAITDRVLSYTPPPKNEKKEKRAKDDASNPPRKEGAKKIPKSKVR